MAASKAQASVSCRGGVPDEAGLGWPGGISWLAAPEVSRGVQVESSRADCSSPDPKISFSRDAECYVSAILHYPTVETLRAHANSYS